MSAHDALCAYTLPEQDRDPNDYCACDLIARVRADERAALNGKLLRLYTQNAHAEAVAAKLVEVICEDAETIDGLRGIRERIAQVVRDSANFIAAEVRRADGKHTMGAGALGETLAESIASRIARGDTPTRDQ